MTRLRHPLTRRGPVPAPSARRWDTWVLAVIVVGILVVVGSLELALLPRGGPTP